MHVVLEFGRYGRDMAAYVLVANLLTRRIYRRYVERKERASAEGRGEPDPLVITIEEAHKFLTPSVAGQTIFGTIAREMRKYNVSLLIVDQRPSGIDQEVVSQLGTKFTCLLDSEPDIDAVLRGCRGAASCAPCWRVWSRSSRRSSSATRCRCRSSPAPATTARPSRTASSAGATRRR